MQSLYASIANTIIFRGKKITWWYQNKYVCSEIQKQKKMQYFYSSFIVSKIVSKFTKIHLNKKSNLQ